jgi:hypothetical protein
VNEDCRWARLGGWLGIAWPLLFVGVMVASSAVGPQTHSLAEELAALGDPRTRHLDMLMHTLMALVGLLGIGWCVGLYRFLQTERPTRSGTIAAVFAVAGFAILMAMLIVQGSVFAGIGEQFSKLTTDAEKSAAVAMCRAVRWVDLGLDFTWDIFIAWSMILFGIAMLGSRRFGRLWGALAIVIAVPLFALDVWYAPRPAEPDLGPVSFIWFLGVSTKMLLYARKERVNTRAHGAVAD